VPAAGGPAQGILVSRRLTGKQARPDSTRRGHLGAFLLLALLLSVTAYCFPLLLIAGIRDDEGSCALHFFLDRFVQGFTMGAVKG
jgi:hypothetical protein